MPDIFDQHSKPLAIRDMTVTDEFWSTEQELVRKEVIPFQWKALNDQVPGTEPSYCMHNFKAAAALNERRGTAEAAGRRFVEPTYTFRGFNALPDDPAHPDPDKFYGFVFQDTDFAKWVETVGYSLAAHPDPDLERTADEAIDIVCAAQLDNGYLDTYYIVNGMDRHFTNLKDHHELYCLGHLIEGAVGYYEGTGKDKLLKAACRFADYVASRFGTGEGKLHGYPGHEIAEMALVRLAEVTGERKYLDLAEYFVRQRGQSPLYFEQEDRERAKAEGKRFWPNNGKPEPYAYYQAHRPVLEQDEAVGHAVRATYLYSGVADVARLTGDAELTEAIRRLWRNIVDKKLYITGGVGSTRFGEAFAAPYELPNDLVYAESCASVALVFLARRMLEIEARSEYADVMENALYNTVLDGMALDGKSFFYVNPLEVRPEALNYDSNWDHIRVVRQKWFGCACCPPNVTRLVASAQEYAYTLSDDGSTLFTHLYMGTDAKVTLGGVPVVVEMNAHLPWAGDGSMTLHCDAIDGVRATMAFRLPAWAGGETAAGVIAASGEAEGRIRREVKDGYVYFSGEWHDGDVVGFDFPMAVHMVAANTRVSADHGRVAFVRGPMVFAAEERDNGALLQNLVVDTAAVGRDCSGVTVTPFEFHAGAEGIDRRGTGEAEHVVRPMVGLQVPAIRVPAPEAHADSGKPESPRTPLYGDWKPLQGEPVSLTLIPYFAWANRGANEMRVWLNAK